MAAAEATTTVPRSSAARLPLIIASFLAATLFVLGLDQFINALTLGAIYALIALGYTMVYGIIELINFAHGDVYMASTFVAMFTIQTLLGRSGAIESIPELVIALVIVFAVTASLMGLAGVVFGSQEADSKQLIQVGLDQVLQGFLKGDGLALEFLGFAPGQAVELSVGHG